MIVLADGPELDPRAVERVLATATSRVVAASYDGTRNHPVVLARSAWAGIPDDGGRALEPVLVDCSDLEPPGDVDVPSARRRAGCATPRASPSARAASAR